MIIRSVLLPSFLLFMLVSSCREGEPSIDDPADPATHPYFDLAAFFTSEIERLNQEQPRVRKRLFLNESKDTIRSGKQNYEEELGAFKEADINKSAYLGKYQIDSLREQETLQEVRYQALEPDFRTRLIRIVLAGSQRPQEILIEQHSHNPIFKTQQHLRYLPDSGYTIERTQKLPLNEAKRIKIEVDFLQ